MDSFPHIGDLFLGRYRVESVLGAGGFARVFLCTQERLDRQVALKVLRPGPLGEVRESSVGARFEREARLISRLKDPNTVRMHDFGQTEDGMLYMILEYVDGETLAEIVAADGAMSAQRVVHVLRGALCSIREAHAMGILHRDLKPANIMVYDHLDERDRVKVLDFGIAKRIRRYAQDARSQKKLTADDALVGTPRYLSPEQAQGDELRPSSDLYSLGLIAYELVTGTKAIAGNDAMDLIAAQLGPDSVELPVATRIPGGLREVIDRMIRKPLDERYESADEVLEDLESWNATSLTGPTPTEKRTVPTPAVEPDDDPTTIPDAPPLEFDDTPAMDGVDPNGRGADDERRHPRRGATPQVVPRPTAGSSPRFSRPLVVATLAGVVILLAVFAWPLRTGDQAPQKTTTQPSQRPPELATKPPPSDDPQLVVRPEAVDRSKVAGHATDAAGSDAGEETDDPPPDVSAPHAPPSPSVAAHAPDESSDGDDQGPARPTAAQKEPSGNESERSVNEAETDAEESSNERDWIIGVD